MRNYEKLSFLVRISILTNINHHTISQLRYSKMNLGYSARGVGLGYVEYVEGLKVGLGFNGRRGRLESWTRG